MMNINETLANYFKDNDPIIDGWNNSRILEFLEAKTPEEKCELAQQLIKNLIEPKKGRLDLLIIELYEVEKATMILTGKRDHVMHSLNTFLLGIYINKNYLHDEIDIFQWMLAALFHDIAYPLEISQKINERYFDKINIIKKELCIENFDPVINLVPKKFENLTNNQNAFEYIQKRIYEWGLNVNVRKRYNDKVSSNEVCHGMLSALTVLYLVDLMYQKNNPQRIDDYDWKQKDFENHIVSACSAIFLHNLSDDAFEKMNRIKAPLPYLLKLCDELQTWDRPDQKTECLFSWNKVQGKDKGRFIKFLKHKLSIDWENTQKIESFAEHQTINVTTNNNHISLKLIDENTHMYIEIDGDRTDDFIGESKNGEINIYDAKDIDSPNNYDISIQENRIYFKVKSKWIRKKISKRIECLNDSNVIVENDTIISGTSH